jgi:phosphohistidine phosphatase
LTGAETLELYFLRHAHAGNPEEWAGDDAERPLSQKGRRQAERLGRFLARSGFQPDVVVTSPKVRAAQTAELFAAALGARIETDDRLGGPLDLGAVAGLLADSGGNKVVLVGHDPDFSDLTAELVGAEYMPLKKGTLVRLDITPPLQPASALLRWMLPPDLIPEDG